MKLSIDSHTLSISVMGHTWATKHRFQSHVQYFPSQERPQVLPSELCFRSRCKYLEINLSVDLLSHICFLNQIQMFSGGYSRCVCFFFLSPSGLIPRLLGDVLSLWICNLLAHLINTYAIDDTVYHLFQLGALHCE